jgi:putative pyruvate formate lyase activating enzyme
LRAARLCLITAAVKAPFSEQLNRCECCPRTCGIDRLAGQTGFCRVPAGILLAHAGLHRGEEPPISGTRGSGTIFFAGCNLRCAFCQNWQISQEFNFNPPRPLGTPPVEGNFNNPLPWRGGRNEVTDGVGYNVLTTDELADEMLRVQSEGAHNINFVSPSHMIYPCLSG